MIKSKKQEVEKVEKLSFFQRGPWLWPKIGYFSIFFFFFRQSRQEDEFYVILELKTRF